MRLFMNQEQIKGKEMEYKEQFCASCGNYKIHEGFERSKKSKMYICEECKLKELEEEIKNDENK